MSDLKEALSRYIQEQTPTSPPSFEGVDVRARHRARQRLAAIAAVPVVLVAITVSTQLAGDPAPGQVAPRATSATDPALGRPSAQTPSSSPASKKAPAPGSSQGPGSGISLASCVETYDLKTLKGRAFAFNGTVSDVAETQPPQGGSDGRSGYVAVTFAVHEWFRGGDPATVTVDMLPGSTQGTVSLPEGASFGVGTRLLVSGAPRFGGSPLKAPVAWLCGFTRQFDKATATAWRQAFGRR